MMLVISDTVAYDPQLEEYYDPTTGEALDYETADLAAREIVEAGGTVIGLNDLTPDGTEVRYTMASGEEPAHQIGEVVVDVARPKFPWPLLVLGGLIYLAMR